MRPKLYVTLMCAMITCIGARDTATAIEAERACIMCTEPNRNYLCAVIPPETGTMAVSPPLFCAREIARKNGHPRCFIIRSNTGQCTGKTILLAYSGPITPPKAKQSELAPQDAPIPEKKAPPKTLLEATNRVAASSEEELKKAGDAMSSAGDAVGEATSKTTETIKDTGSSVGSSVYNTVKMTLNCVITLFQSCD